MIRAGVFLPPPAQAALDEIGPPPGPSGPKAGYL